MTSVLERIVESSRAQVAERRDILPIEVVQAVAAEAPPRRAFGGLLKRPNQINVIAEYKRRSPSKGVIREDLAPQDVARAYEAAGAAALSVLTEEEFFGGHLDHLTAASGATDLPVLQKDFIVDAYQVWEARASGASAVLLIVAALKDAEIANLLAEAEKASLEALVEVHDAAEIDRALGAGASIIGVNNRDLATMEVRLETSLAVVSRLPATAIKVSESGIEGAGDIRRLRAAGFDAFLIGGLLMRSPDPGGALAALIREAKG